MVCTLDTMEPKPSVIICVPSVAMKGGSFSLAIITPLQKPKNTPTTSTRISAGISGQPHSLYATPPSSAEQSIFDPSERSMPPVIITNVTPNAI